MPSTPLEPSAADVRSMGIAALDFLESPDNGSTADREHAFAPAEAGRDLVGALSVLGWAVRDTTPTTEPGYMAYIPNGGLITSAVGELLSRGINRYTAVADTAPRLVALEQSVLDWLADEFGLPPGHGGNLTTGASMAGLSALVAARHEHLGEDFTAGTIYLTEHTHHSLAKAAKIAGFPARAVRIVPSTAEHRMDLDAAADMIARDRAAGRTPFLVIGTAGTTATGAVDDLSGLAALAAHERLWFHVDAAYGGFFHLTSRGRSLLAGIGSADSIALDPHKGMFLPYGTGALLVRDAAALARAHEPDLGAMSYLQDLRERALPDYADLGIERTREFRGLRIWLPLWLHGIGAFRAALDEKLDLAALAHSELDAEPTIHCRPEPSLSIVTFRMSDESTTRTLFDELVRSEAVFCSSVTVDGTFLIRLCVLSVYTHRDHVREAVRIIVETARAISAGARSS